MKNLTLILSIIFLCSCGGNKKSTLGSWSSDDLKQCEKDLLYETSTMPEFEMFESLGEDMSEVVTCICEQIEDMYPSYMIADLQIENDMNEDDAAIMWLSCMSENIQEMYRMNMEYDY